MRTMISHLTRRQSENNEYCGGVRSACLGVGRWQKHGWRAKEKNNIFQLRNALIGGHSPVTRSSSLSNYISLTFVFYHPSLFFSCFG